MKENRSNTLTIILIICFVIQAAAMCLGFGYAFLGEYTANRPSNIWSQLWSHGLGLVITLSNLVSLVLGIVGLVVKKKNKLQIIFSILLILAFFPGVLSIIFAVGSHF